MTSRKTSADNEGWKRGQGPYSEGKGYQYKKTKLDRGYDPFHPKALSDGDEQLAVADRHSHHSSNDDAGLRQKQSDTPFTDPWGESRDLTEVVEANQMGGGGPLKPRGGQS